MTGKAKKAHRILQQRTIPIIQAHKPSYTSRGGAAAVAVNSHFSGNQSNSFMLQNPYENGERSQSRHEIIIKTPLSSNHNQGIISAGTGNQLQKAYKKQNMMQQRPRSSAIQSELQVHKNFANLNKVNNGRVFKNQQWQEEQRAKSILSLH